MKNVNKKTQQNAHQVFGAVAGDTHCVFEDYPSRGSSHIIIYKYLVLSLFIKTIQKKKKLLLSN